MLQETYLNIVLLHNFDNSEIFVDLAFIQSYDCQLFCVGMNSQTYRGM